MDMLESLSREFTPGVCPKGAESVFSQASSALSEEALFDNQSSEAEINVWSKLARASALIHAGNEYLLDAMPLLSEVHCGRACCRLAVGSLLAVEGRGRID